jgi:hypothetical protein
MTPAALGTIVFRFIALGVTLYGIVLIAKGVITHVEANRASAQWTALFAEHPESPGISIGSPFTKVAATLYVTGGGTVLAGCLLYLGSRRLGSLIARDV